MRAGQPSFQGNQARSVREPREPQPWMCHLTALDLGPSWKCSESMTEYLTQDLCPSEGCDPKGPQLGAVGKHTWPEMLDHCCCSRTLGAACRQFLVAQGAASTQFSVIPCRKEACKVCCVGNVHSQSEVTALLRSSLLWHPGRMKHPDFPSQLQFKEAAW